MTKPLRVGIAGLGAVGANTVKLLRQQSADITDRTKGRPIEIVAISAENRNKKRDCDIEGLRWVDNALDMASDPTINVVVETIGEDEGIARELVTAALKNGKSVVTANKALIAKHGVELAKLAEAHGVTLAFEAAVGGAIPIIKALRKGRAPKDIQRISGILNGTCNYILTRMTQEKCSFDEALKEAQVKSYAEKEPSLDIDGTDTAHKLAILASMAFGIVPSNDNIHVEGICSIRPADIEFAGELGYVIKLLGIAAKTEDGIELRVHPCLVKQRSELASTRGVNNAILVDGATRYAFLQGRGAGGEPTAESVISDLVDIAKGETYKPFDVPASSLKPAPPLADLSRRHSEYYLRLDVKDAAAAASSVEDILSRTGISTQSESRTAAQSGAVTQLAFTTQETTESSMQEALAAIKKLGTVEDAYMMRIEPMQRALPPPVSPGSKRTASKGA